MKTISDTFSGTETHWVGDGFPVRSLFSHMEGAEAFSPFLLLDYAGPHQFPPAASPRGVGEHPHRGFETVTIVYQGEVEHLDSSGAGGRIGPGDVQWMTAGAGILHQEFHSHEFTRTGGTLEMVQLWVNLPASEKAAEPTYQTLLDARIPVVALDDGAGTARVIAGEFGDGTGPAHTRTPMNVVDLRLEPDRRIDLPLTEGWTAVVIVLAGTVQVNDTEVLRAAGGVRLGRAGQNATIETNTEARLLILEGQPIDEPVAAYGPFVMNTAEEIRTALTDYREGRFGRLPETPASPP